MLPELAFALAVLAVVLVLATGEARRLAAGLLAGSAGCLWLAVGALAAALLRGDTSLLYVVEQSRLGTSWARRLSGLWSGAEGSLLLYAAIVVTVLLVGAARGPRWQRGGAAVIAAGLAGAVAWGADPFVAVALPPAGGVGMAPILEHGAMFVHPPLLYVATALAMAPALVRSTVWARRLSMVALGLLTAALALGASWAYVELGWGGWWAWDPIENVGLVVWLLLAAGLHAELVDGAAIPCVDDRGDPSDSGAPAIPSAAIAAKPVLVESVVARPVFWYGCCWPAVFAGTALTRTSLRTSVHAFADAEELSMWLWPLAAVAAVGAALRVAEGGRAKAAPASPGAGPAVVGNAADRESAADSMRATGPAVVGNATDRESVTDSTRATSPAGLRNAAGSAVIGWSGLAPIGLLGLATVIVALGTWRPFVGGDGTEPWFYNRTLLPIAAASAALVGLAPLVQGRRFTRDHGRLAVLAGGAGAVLAFVLDARSLESLLLAGALAVGAAMVLADVGRRPIARSLAHVGVLLVLVGALGGFAGTDAQLRLAEGEGAYVEGRRIDLQAIELDGTDPATVTATLVLDRRHVLAPSVARYEARNLRLPEIATHSRPWGDVQTILRSVDEAGTATVTVRLRPLTQLVWWGAALITIAVLARSLSRDRPRSAPPAPSLLE